MTDARKLLEEARDKLIAAHGPSVFTDRIDAYLASGGWISVDDRLPPEKDTDCLVFCGWIDVATYEPKIKTRMQNHAWFSEPAGINPFFGITHWQHQDLIA